jgi:hypothetical protein
MAYPDSAPAGVSAPPDIESGAGGTRAVSIILQREQRRRRTETIAGMRGRPVRRGWAETTPPLKLPGHRGTAAVEINFANPFHARQDVVHGLAASSYQFSTDDLRHEVTG